MRTHGPEPHRDADAGGATSQGGSIVTTRCERNCGRHAVTLWHNATTDREWLLCAVHSDANADALDQQGYELVIDERIDTLAPA